MRKILMLFVLVPPMILAQTPKTSQKDLPRQEEQSPQLTSTEIIAFNAVKQLVDQANSELRAMQTDIAKEHPGFYLDPQTGKIEKLPTPKPEPKK